MKGKDDYGKMAKEGNSPEERRIGRIVSSILNSGIQGEGVPMKFEVYVIPWRKEEMSHKFSQYKSALDVYAQAYKDYEKANPQKEGENILDYHTKMADYIKARHPVEDNVLDEIRKSADDDKKRLFVDLAAELENLMYDMRNRVSYNILSGNLDIAFRVLAEKQYVDVKDDLIRLDEELEKVYERYCESPASASVLKSLEMLKDEFFSKVGRPLREMDKSIKFDFEVFTGKMNSTYFMNNDDFFDTFKHYKNGCSDISFDLNGALEGEHSLDMFSGQVFKGLDYGGNYFTARMFSPVMLKIEIPEKYAGPVKALFDRLRDVYGSKIVPQEDLRDWSK